MPGMAYCATRSAEARMAAPMSPLVAMPGDACPRSGLAMAGAHSATNEIGPRNAHVTAVRITAAVTVTIRTTAGRTPRPDAVGAPSCTIGSQRADAVTAGIITTNTTAT